MKKGRKNAIISIFCMSIMVMALPGTACSAAETESAIPQPTNEPVSTAPAVSTEPELYPAKKSDVWISNFQNWTKKRVVFGSESSASKGMDGSEIEVREVKNGNVVYMAKDAFLFTGAKAGVLYQYRIRYSKRLEGNPSQFVSGAWSEYRYFGIPQLSGTRTTKKVQVKWKKMWGATGYDIYKLKDKMQLKRTLGKMGASSWPAGKYAGKLQKIKPLGKNKTQVTMKNTSNKITYVIVVPKFKVKGKNVKNDLESYVYH